MHHFRRPHRAFLRRRLLPGDSRGVAATEFVMISLAVLAMLMGVFDLGVFVWQRMQIQAALGAGAVFAQEFPTQFAGICQTITGALPANASNVTTTVALTAPDCPYNTSQTSGGCNVPACATGAAGSAAVTLTVSWPFVPIYLTSLLTNQVSYVVTVQ
jgi:Flp pilus assembly protein TadG